MRDFELIGANALLLKHYSSKEAWKEGFSVTIILVNVLLLHQGKKNIVFVVVNYIMRMLCGRNSLWSINP